MFHSSCLGKRNFSANGVIKVVKKGMQTKTEKISAVIAPYASPMLARISSTAPRPFIANPMIAESRLLWPSSLAVRPAPATLPIIAVEMIAARKPIEVGFVKKEKSTWKPRDTKKIGPKKL